MPSPVAAMTTAATAAVVSGSRAADLRRAAQASTAAAARPPVHAIAATGCHQTGTISPIVSADAGLRWRAPFVVYDGMPRRG